jgi:hypothetical protein
VGIFGVRAREMGGVGGSSMRAVHVTSFVKNL